MSKIQTINPATNQVIKTFEEDSDTTILKSIEGANKFFEKYKKTSFAQRSKLMHKASDILLDEKERFAKLMTIEMGKPIKEAIAEIEKCAWVCRYYADNAERFLMDEKIKTEAASSFISYEPLGIILAVMPWNFPFWQVFRFAAPALMAGNVCLLKHASNVPQCALAIEEVFRKAKFGNAAFKTLLIGSACVSKIIEDDRVQAVTLTGSDIAGASVGEVAGRNIKKVVLELGGSDPFIVLEDADIETAAQTAVTSRMISTGQSCIAAKRFIVMEIIANDFVKLMKQKMSSLIIGDPMDEATEVGPLARMDMVDELSRQVEESIRKGAKVVLGADITERKGAYYSPTILKNVKPGMPVYNEEVFGPVAAIITVREEEEAIRVANDTKFGLGAAIWTADIEKGERLARRINAGCVFVNSIVKSDPRLPFGGIKKSGYGRELSYHGIREFVNIKTVWVN
ncbi:MAG: NAD-dependent succinate-semialdehyde dehydrogenase [Bacteroidota bacterium]